MSSPRLFATIVLSAICACAIPAYSQQVPYNVTAVGNAGSQGLGINNTGTVVGRTFTFGPSSATYLGFFNTGAGPVNMGTLGGVNSMAVAVNDAGRIVGSADTANGVPRGFLFQGGTISDLGTFGGASSHAYGINANGYVVGSAFPPPSTDPNVDIGSRAFVLPPGGKFQNIGTLPFPSPFSEAFDINSSGQIVGSSGQSGPGDPPSHPFLYTNGVMIDLGTFGEGYSMASAINDLGQVVGYSDVPTGAHSSHAFLYQNGVLTDLNARLGAGESSIATDINNLGQIVGTSTSLGAFVLRGAEVQSVNALIDPSSGWQITEVNAINDHGQIAGTGRLNGASYAVLLTPVPEPGIVGMLLLGLCLLVLSRGSGQWQWTGSSSMSI